MQILNSSLFWMHLLHPCRQLNHRVAQSKLCTSGVHSEDILTSFTNTGVCVPERKQNRALLLGACCLLSLVLVSDVLAIGSSALAALPCGPQQIDRPELLLEGRSACLPSLACSRGYAVAVFMERRWQLLFDCVATPLSGLFSAHCRG